MTYIARAGDVSTTWTWADTDDGPAWVPGYAVPRSAIRYRTRADAKADVTLCMAIGRIIIDESVSVWLQEEELAKEGSR